MSQGGIQHTCPVRVHKPPTVRGPAPTAAAPPAGVFLLVFLPLRQPSAGQVPVFRTGPWLSSADSCYKEDVFCPSSPHPGPSSQGCKDIPNCAIKNILLLFQKFDHNTFSLLLKFYNIYTFNLRLLIPAR